MKDQQYKRMSQNSGFIAALDQSGGSTPKALKQYGLNEDSYSNDQEMFEKVHQMRTRIITSPVFTGEKVLGAILFEKTMDDQINGTPTAQYMLEELNILPFLKIDKGLADENDGVQLMKAMPDLDSLLKRANDAGIFGTKMRSVIHSASKSGIDAVVAQQFEVGKQILAHGLVPIIEPEVNIHASDKAECEALMKDAILSELSSLDADQKVMLKLTLPETANFYKELVDHEKILKVVALSGGYDIDEACKRLAENNGMIASFSRALTNDLRVSQTDEEFDTTLGDAIERIYQASNT